MPSTEDGIDGRPQHHLRVHRIKVDELVGITLATTQFGGLIVRDMETDEVLWQLPAVSILQSFSVTCTEKVVQLSGTFVSMHTSNTREDT